MNRISYVILFLVVFLSAFLRLYKLDQNPPSPYWEEAALGYDAFSILKTGRDHHGNPYPIVAFESFGDWKPSLYFYATTIAEFFFGLNTFSVRLTSALSGIATVLVCYFLCKRMFDHNTAIASSLLLAVVPWHVLISRVGFETNLGFFLAALGFLLFTIFVNDKSPKGTLALVAAIVIWGLSLYAYHSNRLFIPLLILSLLVCNIKKITDRKVVLTAALLLFVIITLPVLSQMNSPQVKQRFAETSALTTLEPILRSNKAIEDMGGTRIAKIIHHRYLYYGKIITANYLKHFDLQYLFIRGDGNRRHSTGKTGQLYLIFIPLLVMGILLGIKNRDAGLVQVACFTLLAPLPSAFTISTPHALRSLPMVLGWCIVAGYGFVSALYLVKKSKEAVYGLVIVGALLLLFETGRFWDHYWNQYRSEYAREWQYGYKELIDYVHGVENEYDQVIVTRDLGRPAMFYWFYTRTDPSTVQSWNSRSVKDQGEFLQFENLYFGMAPDVDGEQLLISSTPSHESSALVKEVKGMQDEPVFYIYNN